MSSERLLVPFAGDRSGTGALSWGQAEIWGEIHQLAPDDAALNMTGITALEDEGISYDTPVERITTTVAGLMKRHESLRTLVRLDPDGVPYQALYESGELTVEVVDAVGVPPGEVAVALQERLNAPAFDYGQEWPLRVGAVRHEGRITHVVFVFCHLATDRGGLNPLIRDILDGLAGKPGQSPSEPPPAQPLDQARHQLSEAGRRQSDKALRYWARQLGAVPADRFAGIVAQPPLEPPFHSAVINSPAMDKAVQVIAARTHVSSSAVLLAAVAYTLAHATGSRTSVLKLIVANRFRRNLADSVSPVSQDGLCVIEVGDDDFNTVVGRAMAASIQTIMHAQYDPAGRERLLAELGAAGREIDLSCSFNDRRFETKTPIIPDVSYSASELRQARSATTFTWEPPLDRYGARFFLHVNEVPNTIELLLVADTTVFPPSRIEAYLTDLETLLIETACAA